MEPLESRTLLTATLAIPTDLIAVPGGSVDAPVTIDAGGISSVDFDLNYDTTVLDASDTSVALGAIWPQNATFETSVDDATGTISVWVWVAEPLDAGAAGSVVSVQFTAANSATAGQTSSLELVSPRVDEVAAEATDGLVTIVSPVNHAPAGTDKTVSTLEDASYTFAVADFGFSDPDDTPPDAFSQVKISTLPAAGTLTLNGTAVTVGQSVTAAQLTAGNLQFAPAANANGASYASFTFQVQDDGGTANSGVDLDPSANTMTINVTSVNDAPAGTNGTVSTAKDTAYTFAVADFGFTDPADTPANALSQVKIATLPSAGSLALSGTAVTIGQSVSVAEITAGNLKFTPASGASGTPYTTFTFQVQDNGGTTNSGVDLDPSANTMTVNVTSGNQPPAGTDKTVTTTEDTHYTFTVADFGFSDPNDSPANTLNRVKITTLPSVGSVTVSGTAVSAGQFVSVADITAGNLKFVPVANASGSSYAAFTFQVEDNGGTANGGVNLDPTPNTITVNVTAVNDAPAGTDKTVTTTEDTSYTFAAADFGFTDASDSPANALSQVKITTLPSVGALTLSGTAVTAGQFVTVANLTAGNLKFAPAANANGSSYASFTFQVQDDGGTSNGGVDLDPTANTMTVSVTAVNDAPAGTDKTVSTVKDTAYTFAVADFGFTDPNDTPANALSQVKITTLPSVGSLALSGTAATVGQLVSVADLTAGNLKFTPASGAMASPYATFTFQVQDNGGTTNGGVDLDASANTMTINVTALNHAPSGTDKTLSTTEDTSYTFAVADFGFTDTSDTPANALSRVKITTLPSVGSVTLSGTAVTAGQFVTVADVTAGNVKFVPAANASGSPYTTFTFQVEDDGGTAGGGVNLDPTANTFTVNVTAVNDAPAVTVPAAQTVAEDTDLTISGVSITDVDAGTASIQVTLSATNGKLTVKTDVTNGVTSSGVTGNGTASVVLTGTLAQINATLADSAGLKYRGNTDYSGSDTLSVTANDQGNTGDGGSKSDTKSVAITVSGANDAPINTVPGAQATPVNTALVFSSAKSNVISIADAEAGTNAVKVTLTVTNGTLKLSGTTGLTFSTGDGTDDTTMTFTGTITNINTALAGMSYQPTADYQGTATLTITTDDQNNTGSGTGLTDTDTVSITVGQTARISGFVYVDCNSNSKPDANEGVPGVMVTLKPSSGSSVVAWTDDRGWYEFSGLGAGTYSIEERQPVSLNSASGSSDTISSITVTAGESKTGQNFREAGLKSEYCSSVLLTFAVRPVGSEKWCAAVRKIINDAETAAGNTTRTAVTQVSLQQSGNELIVQGTDAADSFEFTPGETTHVVTVNGEAHQYSATEVKRVTFDGGQGSDTAKVNGSTGTETAELRPMSGTVKGTNYEVAVSAEKIQTDGGSQATDAKDTLTLVDSYYDDTLQAEDNLARLWAWYFDNSGTSYETVTAKSQAGGTDKIKRTDPLDYVLSTEGTWATA